MVNKYRPMWIKILKCFTSDIVSVKAFLSDLDILHILNLKYFEQANLCILISDCGP